jgi:hypothetical protein
MATAIDCGVIDAARAAKLLEWSPIAWERGGNQPPEHMEGTLTFFDPGWDISRLWLSLEGADTVPHGGFAWHETADAARRTSEPHFRRLCMRPVPGSPGERFAASARLLTPGHAVPRLRAVVMGMTLCFRATGAWLFPDCWIRTADTLWPGCRFLVSGQDAGALPRISAAWDSVRYVGRDTLIGLGAEMQTP